MSILARLRKYRNDAPETPTEAPQEPQEGNEGNDITEKEEALRERIKGFLYDDTLVEQLLPVFMKMEAVEGSESIFELIEAKETQVSNLLDNESAFEGETNPDDRNIPADDSGDEDEEEEDLVMKILSEKYGE